MTKLDPGILLVIAAEEIRIEGKAVNIARETKILITDGLIGIG